jgi:hypothetical protein
MIGTQLRQETSPLAHYADFVEVDSSKTYFSSSAFSNHDSTSGEHHFCTVFVPPIRHLSPFWLIMPFGESITSMISTFLNSSIPTGSLNEAGSLSAGCTWL